MCTLRIFFFFQAEDGIRDYKVTGVQTCALPIFSGHTFVNLGAGDDVINVHDDSHTLEPFQGLLTVSGDVPRANVINLADRKSTRLNSSHLVISYAVFCLKKKREIVPEPLSRTPI